MESDSDPLRLMNEITGANYEQSDVDDKLGCVDILKPDNHSIQNFLNYQITVKRLNNSSHFCFGNRI